MSQCSHNKVKINQVQESFSFAAQLETVTQSWERLYRPLLAAPGSASKHRMGFVIVILNTEGSDFLKPITWR